LRAASGRRFGLLAALVGLLCACHSAPVPSEVREAERLEATLERAGASLLTPEPFGRFKKGMSELRLNTTREKAKFGWWRDFRGVAEQGRIVAALGRDVLTASLSRKEGRESRLREAEASIKERMARLVGMTRFFNEDDIVRKALTQAEIKLGEMALLVKGEKFEDAGLRLGEASNFASDAEREILRLLRRYRDPQEQKKWKRWAEETIADSQAKGTTAIIVSKLDRTLSIYKRGIVTVVFEIGLGKYGLSDKLYQGDEATPEGKYRIVRKYPDTPFYKALLINYPNAEDLRVFAEARRKGLIPGDGKDAGGAIEVHGGGKNKLTQGCVGLENKDMDEVYRMAEIGTVVTIVGTLAAEGTILSEIDKFEIK
jgi:L,D-peptidoglycan transpeptidase YkuD (ErfK/YbiS/YcfS/YnhG family)